MTLNFQKADNGYYVATATVNADFNLHLEFSGDSRVIVSKSGVASGKKMVCYSARVGEVCDQDFNDIVYPKYIEVKVSTLPSSGIITENSNG